MSDEGQPPRAPAVPPYAEAAAEQAAAAGEDATRRAADAAAGEKAAGGADAAAGDAARGAADAAAGQGAAVDAAGRQPTRPYPGVVDARPGPGRVPPPPREAWRPARRIDAVPGSPFGLVHLDVLPVTSGLAVGALVTGTVSILIALLVVFFGLVGAGGGWGAWVAGAFAVLAGFFAVAGIVLGRFGLRQIKRGAPPPAIRFTGRGLAVAGLGCAVAGLGITLFGFALAVLLQVV